MKDIYAYKDFAISTPVQFKDVDGRKGIVTGYFADFDTLDSDGDVIKPGAFARTINATGPKSAKPRIKHLMNHDPSQPLGVIMVLKEDDKGLYYESKLGSHTLGVDFVKMAESGLITEHSIGYQTKKFNQVTSWEDWKEGDIRRELTELKLWEGSSLTSWGANPNTPLTGLKNQTELNKLINKAEAIESFCRSSKATDETIEMLLLYNKQLLQSITDLKSTQPAAAIDTDEEEIDETKSLTNKDKAFLKEMIPHHQMAIDMSSDIESDSDIYSFAKGIIKTQSSEIVKMKKWLSSEKSTDPVKTTLPDVVECPKCHKNTHSSNKGYVKCHRCDAVFVYGSNIFLNI